ncbi:MAG TPA: TetR family transcriptional regulator C-terminal domain-containing protein [Geminicoccaceae bacterium]|mgnify:CR=1 FL=1|nr:TetR family transcriptional regulator C-terminal domain-containing protein [Geminicoccus sp.]HMU52023.1 TetR family transcriptional regulator C-terminal domain-containing protein [Geminicoccaceae bacterium]
MSRPRAFEEEAVLERALGQFWKGGYDGTTIGDLEAATGLGRGSLYGAFGDKRRLFLRALEHYLDQASAERLQRLADPAAGRGELVAFFRDAARGCSADPSRKGCLVTNCAVEMAAEDVEVAARVGRHLDRFERAIERVVRQAQARGEIAADRDPTRLARLLVVCLQGMQVLARARPDACWLDDVVRAVDETLG